ncbi:MAG: glycosyltransferase family A protein [Candidatus Micrarchaeia archaeon]|jgi:hypothetical protein
MQQQATQAVYRVKAGYSIQLPFQRTVQGGELLENPSPELVRLNAWKLDLVKSADIAPDPLPVASVAPGGDISIIIPAWKAADFLQECLDSLVAQTYFQGGAQHEILLGVDACKSTRWRALKIAQNYENLQIHWFSNNYGPYLVKNSLAALAKHDRLLFFDTDDTANPDMIERLLEHDKSPGGTAVYMMGTDMESGEQKQTCGVFLIRKKIFLAMGGFMPWPCAADTEFMKRLTSAKIKAVCANKKPLMNRRVHKNQITVKPDTGFGSDLRACYIQQIKQIQRLGVVNIGLVTAKSERLA